MPVKIDFTSSGLEDFLAKYEALEKTADRANAKVGDGLKRVADEAAKAKGPVAELTQLSEEQAAKQSRAFDQAADREIAAAARASAAAQRELDKRLKAATDAAKAESDAAYKVYRDGVLLEQRLTQAAEQEAQERQRIAAKAAQARGALAESEARAWKAAEKGRQDVLRGLDQMEAARKFDTKDKGSAPTDLLGKTLAKALTGEVISGALSRLSAALSQSDDKAVKLEGTLAHIGSELTQGFFSGGPAGLAFAAVGAAIEQVAAASQREAEKEKALADAAKERWEKSEQAIQGFRDQLKQAATQLNIIKGLQEGLTPAQASARADVTQAQIGSANARKRVTDAENEVAAAMNEVAAQGFKDTSSEFAQMVAGFRRLFKVSTQAQDRLTAARAALEQARSDAGIAEAGVGTAETVAGVVKATETATTKKDLTDADRQHSVAMSALNIQERTHLDNSRALLMAERDFITTKKQTLDGTIDETKRNERLTQINYKLAESNRAVVVATQQAIDELRVQGAIQTNALNDQIQNNTNAAIAQAKAAAKVFRENPGLFPQFQTQEQIDAEQQRRDAQAAITTEQVHGQALIASKNALDQQAVSLRALQLVRDRGFPQEIAQSQATIEDMKARREQLIKNEGEEAYNNNLLREERQLKESLQKWTKDLTNDEYDRVLTARAAAQQITNSLEQQIVAEKEATSEKERALALTMQGLSSEEVARRLAIEHAREAASAKLQELQTARELVAVEFENSTNQDEEETLRERAAAIDREIKKTKELADATVSRVEVERQAANQARLNDMASGFLTEPGKQLGQIFGVVDELGKIREGSYEAAAALNALGDIGAQAFGSLARGIGSAVQQWAMYSHAQEAIQRAQHVTAAESKAASEAQVQAVLAGIAQQSAIKAVYELAEGLASLATPFTAPMAPFHFAASATYAGIAGATAIGARAIGETRGATHEENQQLASARGVGAGGAGGSGSGSGNGKGLTINVYSPLYSDQGQLNRMVEKGLDDWQRWTT